MLLALVVLAPLLTALPAGLTGRAGRYFLLLGASLSLSALFMLYPTMMAGGMQLEVTGWLMPGGLQLQLNGLGWLLAVVSCLVWVCASLFSYEYMAYEHAHGRYYATMALTLSGAAGVALAGDLITLLVFFELMTFASYFLVVHSKNREARLAGNTYLYLGAVGGLLLMAAMVLVYANTGTLQLQAIGSLWQGPLWTQGLTAALFIAGFGIKAGVVPLHVWLPQAHPVAPSPASAILSGILIKIGAYGIIRVVGTLFAPSGAATAIAEHGAVASGDLAASLGYVLIWLGIVTMLTGVSLALLQENAKRMLAYHSVSQMGYIIMGIGAAAYLGSHGALAMAGSLYHIVNHALFKSALFMMVGAVYLRTHELNMYNLGGMMRTLPYIALFGAIASMGITGVPGCNGYISKTLLHHAIVEAYEHGGRGLLLAERLFVLTSMGTVCSFIKLFSFIFLGKSKAPDQRDAGQKPPSLWGLGILSAAIVGLGVAPYFFIERAVVPALAELGFSGYALDHLMHVDFWGWHDLSGILPAMIGGSIIFVVGVKYHLFHLHAPAYVSVDYLVRTSARRIGRNFSHHMVRVFNRIDYRVARLGWLANDAIAHLIGAYDRLQVHWMRSVALNWSDTVTTLRHMDQEPGESSLLHRQESQLLREMNVQNLNFAAVVVVVVLAALLLVRFSTLGGLTQ